MRFKHPRHLFILLGVWTIIGLAFASLSYFGTIAITEYGRVDLVGIFFWNLIAFYLWAFLSPLIALLARRFRFDRHTWARSSEAFTSAARKFW